MIYSTHSTLCMHAAHMRARFDPRFGEVVFSPPTAGNMLINNLAEAPWTCKSTCRFWHSRSSFWNQNRDNMQIYGHPVIYTQICTVYSTCQASRQAGRQMVQSKWLLYSKGSASNNFAATFLSSDYQVLDMFDVGHVAPAAKWHQGKRLNLVAIFVSLLTPWVLFCSCLAQTGLALTELELYYCSSWESLKKDSPHFSKWFSAPRHFCCPASWRHIRLGESCSIFGALRCLEMPWGNRLRHTETIGSIGFSEFLQELPKLFEKHPGSPSKCPSKSCQVLPATLLEPLSSVVIGCGWTGADRHCSVLRTQDLAAGRSGFVWICYILVLCFCVNIFIHFDLHLLSPWSLLSFVPLFHLFIHSRKLPLL